MNYSEKQFDSLGDAFRLEGFDTNNFIIDNDYYSKLADSVLNGLGLKITNKSEHEKALKIVSHLMDQSCSCEFVSRLIDTLALIVEDFENNHRPARG